jgi:uncharacterized SAM-binding protein YcdF (DUF218 family)
MNERDALWAVTEPDVRPDPGSGSQGYALDGAATTAEVEVEVEARSGRRFRRSRRLALAFFALLTAYFVVCLAQVWSTGKSDHAQPVDAIVVLGAAQYDGRPSPQLAARLDHTAELYARGLAPIIVVTGGKQPADRYTEAGASALYLIEAGVPAEAILQEDVGRSTWQSLEGVARMLGDRGVDRVLLVTDPYHSLRSRLIAAELGLDATTSPTRSSPVRGLHAGRLEVKEAAGIAIGRIIGFERLWKVTG